MVPETNFITIKAEDDGKDPISGKESWMMSTSALLGVVAELWTEVLTDARTAEARAGLRKLDVAAVLWERLLHKHALKSVAQRALLLQLRHRLADEAHHAPVGSARDYPRAREAHARE